MTQFHFLLFSTVNEFSFSSLFRLWPKIKNLFSVGLFSLQQKLRIATFSVTVRREVTKDLASANRSRSASAMSGLQPIAVLRHACIFAKNTTLLPLCMQ